MQSICEYDSRNLECGEGRVLNIIHAFEGRTTQTLTECKVSVPTDNSTCSMTDITTVLGDQCNGRQSCTVHFLPSEVYLNESCPGIVKYVVYTGTCTPAPIITPEPPTCHNLDLTGGLDWHDSYGSKYTCAWYSQNVNRCDKYGAGSPNSGLTANQACCVCGGGTSTVVEQQPPTLEWGSGCGEGSRTFEMHLLERFATKTVGIIPKGKFEVEIKLHAVDDIDISLFDLSDTSNFPEGRAIVQWCSSSAVSTGQNCGLLRGPREQTLEYKGMTITYSGFNGINGHKGHESILIHGETSEPLNTLVYAYKVGVAQVSYSWGVTQTPCCLGVPNACGGSFQAVLAKGYIQNIGVIPVGKAHLQVNTISDVDVDIQLYDLDDTSKWSDGQAIIAYCKYKDRCNYGPLTSPNAVSTDYQQRHYSYSGFNGVDGHKGNEYIIIAGTTNRELNIALFAFESGNVTVEYSYTEPQLTQV